MNSRACQKTKPLTVQEGNPPTYHRKTNLLKTKLQFRLCLVCLAGLCLAIIRVHVSGIPSEILNFTTSRIVPSLGKWNQSQTPAISVALLPPLSPPPVFLGSSLSGLPRSPGPTQQVQFIAAIKQRLRSTQGVILLAMVDAPFVKMAINFYKTSLQPFQIENYLFVGVSDRACALLSDEGLPCFKYAEDTASEKASVYMSKYFIRKTRGHSESADLRQGSSSVSTYFCYT